MIIEVSVTTGAKKFSIRTKDGRVRISLRNPPENNKANLELIKELSSLLGRQVRIIAGQTSRRKRLSMDISEAEWTAFVDNHPSP
ncbi:MAG: DUF167 domain-containing protein [Candidatus Micrarchaeota archaeon]